MYCCSNCFNHQEIKLIIEEIANKKGNCDFCGKESCLVVDPREIVESFQSVINLYEVSTKGEYLLHKIIQVEWNIFNLEDNKINSLLQTIFSDEKSICADIFTEKVINKTCNHQVSLGIVTQWDSLKKEIVEKNRFFLENVIDLNLLKKYLTAKVKTYKRGDVFYRGRISKQSGFKIHEMGKPPVEKATSGRANPIGIAYLYLSSNKETTLYETRATYLDYVTIGIFHLKKDINLIKLRTVGISSPFEENLNEKLIYQPFLKSLEKDLSRPLRRYDTELDYLPTQYLCEYIKSIGYDGVEYGSAMIKGGINIAVFDDSNFECLTNEVFEIKNITFSDVFTNNK